MSTLVYLGALIVALRILGAVLRSGEADLPARIAGWLPCALAGWLAAGAAGALFPMWPVAVITAVGALVAVGPRRRLAWAAGDVVTVLICGVYSSPPLGIVPLFGGAAGFAVLGLLADLAGARIAARRWIIAGAVAGVTAAALAVTWTGRETARLVAEAVPEGAVLPMGVPGARRVVLETGAVAWFDKAKRAEPVAAVLFFHGAHRDGANQPTAVVIRRTLIEAGFAVLSVDHLAYGQTPAPPEGAPVEAWDPLPNDLAGLSWLRRNAGVDRVIAIGHSMGTTDVMRLLASGAKVDGAVVLGASLQESGQRDDYWYERFHLDRHLAYRVGRETWRRIHTRYYDPSRFHARLPAGHPPIAFVVFDGDHKNVTASRGAYYAALSAPKTTWSIDSTHYLNTDQSAGLMVADTAAARSFKTGLMDFLDGLGAN